jgi:hypothetical protein
VDVCNLGHEREHHLTLSRSGREQVSRIEEVVKDVPCDHILGLVLDGLPLKHCSATGTGPTEDPWSYSEEYIDRKELFEWIYNLMRADCEQPLSEY